MPWGAVIGGATALAGSAMSANAASQNSAASQQTAANELAATRGYGINSNFGNTQIDANTNTASGQLSGQYQGLESGYLGNAGLFNSNLSNLSQTGGINPLLQSAFNQYQSSIPQSQVSSVPNNIPGAFFGNQQQYQGLTNQSAGLASQYGAQAANPTQLQNNGLGAQMAQTGSSILSQYGSYDPNQAAQSYASNLNALQAPQQQLAAQGLGQQLFNSGNLGSTGGANQMQALQTSQGLQQTANNVAGQQLGYQNQLGMLNAGQSLASTGTGLDQSYASLNQGLANSAASNYQNSLNGAFSANTAGTNALYNQSNTAYNRGMTNETTQYQQQGTSAQNLYNAALGLQGAGQSNLQTAAGLSSGMLNSGQTIDQNLLNQIQLGGSLGAARTGAAVTAGNTALAGQVASNNANASMYSGLFNSIGNANWGSLFSGSNPNGGNSTGQTPSNYTGTNYSGNIG